jgi:hypothetical protein
MFSDPENDSSSTIYISLLFSGPDARIQANMVPKSMIVAVRSK